MTNSKKKSKKKGKKTVPATADQSIQAKSANSPGDNLQTSSEQNATYETINTTNRTTNATNGRTHGVDSIRNVTKTSDGSSTCKVCSNNKTGDWLVQCDDCDQNYHFDCAKFIPGGDDDPWSCAECVQKVLSSTAHKQDASQAERDLNSKISSESKRLSDRIFTRQEYVAESEKLRREFMQRIEGLATSYHQRRVSQSLPELQKAGLLRQTQNVNSTAVLENISSIKNADVVPNANKSAEKEPERQENTLADQSTKRQRDDVSIRTGTSFKSQKSSVRSVLSKASKTSSQRLRDVELQKVQEEYELEKKMDEERLALERKALELKEIREKKLLDAKYRAIEEIVSVHSTASTSDGASKKSVNKTEISLRSSMINRWIEKQIELVKSRKSLKPLDVLPTEVNTKDVNPGQSINISIPVEDYEIKRILKSRNRQNGMHSATTENRYRDDAGEHDEPSTIHQNDHRKNGEKVGPVSKANSYARSDVSQRQDEQFDNRSLDNNSRISRNFDDQKEKLSTHSREENFDRVYSDDRNKKFSTSRSETSSEHREKDGNRNDEFTKTNPSSDNQNGIFNIPSGHLPNLQTPTRNDGSGKQQIPVKLSPNQIASRHTIGKDGLPYFYGHPKDWIQFIKTYEDTTELCGFTNSENLSRLRKYLKGKARELVESQLFMPECVHQIIATLRGKFGKPELIAQATLEKIRTVPPIKPDKLEALADFGYKVNNACNVIESMGMQFYLYDPDLVRDVVAKLPSQTKMDWAKHAKRLQTSEVHVNFRMIADWLHNLAETLNLVTSLDLDSMQSEQNTQKKSEGKSGFVNFHEKPDTASQTSKKCPSCSNDCKYVGECSKFKGLTVDDRWKLVKQLKLCKRCLRGHGKICTNTNFRTCGLPGCELKHNTLLHNEERHSKFNSNKPNNEKSKEPRVDKTSDDTTTGKDTSSIGNRSNPRPNNVHQVGGDEELFRILPVKLFHNGVSIETFAFLDEGSSYTLMEKHSADKLNATGVKENICLLWTKGIHRQEESLNVNLEISGVNESDMKYKLKSVNVVEDLGLTAQTVDPHGLAKRFKYLKGLPLFKYKNAVPTILIGLRHIRLTTPLETIEGGENEPIASRSRLGWTVCGPIDGKGNRGIVNHHVVTKCPCKDRDEDLHKIIKDHFSIENFGVSVNSTDMESKENRQALDMLKKFTIRKGDRFETRLLWKNYSYVLPDSYAMARKRLTCLENKGAGVVKTINEIIDDYLTKGYASKLSSEELKKKHPRTFYLPIFTVTNPKKPDKIRPVFDAAATVNGTSLNSTLLTGPDLLSPLVDILRRFREHRIAVSGDIKEMFYRVLVNEEDRHSQRFLWRNGERNREPDVYEFNVMTFGSKCSPTSAQYVKNINAEEYRIEFPDAYESITKNHYVDDMLDGANSTGAAIKLINDVKYVHSRGGFEIRNFKSNSKEVLNAIGETSEAKQVDLAEDKIKRVLGMFWDTELDCFRFSLRYTKLTPEILQGITLPTKREILRLTMSLFDPLGLISYYTIHARILMQNVWKTEIGWDEKLPDSLEGDWHRWIKLLPGVENLKLPRWYSIKLGIQPQPSTELHIFVDAGEDAYAAVAYLRISDNNGTECSLVGSKARVTPLKYLSNTRKELLAAVLGSRLVNSVKDGLSLNVERKVIWSDSTTVLTWLHSEHKKYTQFVAHRVGEILESTNLTEWRWVPTKLNAADEATKWGKIPTFDASNRWFIGPDFLQRPESEWPPPKAIIANGTTEEMRVSCSHSRLIMPSIVDATKFSTWQRLVRAVANAKRIATWMVTKHRKLTLPSLKLSQRDLIESERKLIRQAQWEGFTEEMTILTRNQSVEPNRKKPIDLGSCIKDCDPYLDEYGVLRVKGRIDSATAVTEDAKRPIILPKENAVTKLVVFSYHKKFQHRNHESAINELKQRFYIPKIRTVLKSVRWSCNLCALRRCKPKNPQMADLPPIRFEAGIRPFTYTGIDYFGPFKVKVGRQYPKRWGIIYTCLTTRAVWLDVVPSYDTDACILSIRDFINRKGVVQTFYTDNGTNLKGANNELINEIKKIDFERLRDEFTTCYTNWIFNPPETPHMGGMWERLVRSVKISLYDSMSTRTPTDQMLRSWLIEAENIINSRPLTFVPVESEDDEALTPNHFMLGSSNGLKPPGIFKSDGPFLRRQWKEVQRCTDIFWKRFIKEYCPTLIRRTKWFEKVKPLEVGDLVINFDENAPRNTYKRARVVETITGTNNQVRRAKVQFPNGSTLWRPANRLGVLDVRSTTPTMEVLDHPSDDKNEGEIVGARIPIERPLTGTEVEMSTFR